jgi:hypothetical protein
MVINGSTQGMDRISKDQDALAAYFEKIQNIDNYSDFPSMDHNPFTCLLKANMKMDYKTKGAVNGVDRFEITDRDSGEIVSGMQSNILFRKKEIVDDEQFMKLYTSQLKDMFALTYPALKVFGYFIKEMQKLKDTTDVFFRLQDCMDFCDYSSRAIVYKGLTELILKGFICKTIRTSTFFINPLYIFNGNRIAIYKEYERKDYFTSEGGRMIE